jgi:hypothetical protein
MTSRSFCSHELFDHMSFPPPSDSLTSGIRVVVKHDGGVVVNPGIKSIIRCENSHLGEIV